MLKNLRHCSKAVLSSDFRLRKGSHVLSVRIELMKVADVLPKSASMRSSVASLGWETNRISSRKKGKSSYVSSDSSNLRTSRSSNSSERENAADLRRDQSGA